MRNPLKIALGVFGILGVLCAFYIFNSLNKPFFAINGLYAGQPLLDCPAIGSKNKTDNTLVCRTPIVFFGTPEEARIVINDGVITSVALRMMDKEMPAHFEGIKNELIDQYGDPFQELTFGSKEVLIWCEEPDSSYMYARVEFDDIFLNIEMGMPVNKREKALLKRMRMCSSK